MPYRDVVIHTNAGIFGKDDELKRFPPVQQRIQLSDQMWVGRLELDVAKLVMDTCEPRVFGTLPPVRQFAQLYSFVRELPGYGAMHLWDHDHELAAVVSLSRLIHPTFVGFKYAARIMYEPEGVKQIFPAQIIGISREAFLSPSRDRDWLIEIEVDILRELVPTLTVELPRRVHNALWHHEYTSRTYYLDHRWTLVCTGLEALIHTDRNRNTAQFAKRVPQLASELGINISEAEAIDAYDLRSRLAHGVSFVSTEIDQGPSAYELQLYDKLEDTLRAAVLRGLRDKSFANTLRNDDEIRKRWPI